MSRGLLLNLSASALTILTAVALLGAMTIVGDGSLASPNLGPSEPVVWRFYDAVNDVLRTGDVSALDAVAAPNLVVHAPAGAAVDRDELWRALRALHATTPGVQLRVEEITVAGDRAVARVSVAGAAHGSFLGLTLAALPAVWEDVDGFRIVENRVVELWSGVAASVSLEPLGELDLAIPPPGLQSLALERLSAPAGEDWELGPYVEPRVMVVVAGAMSVYSGSAPPAEITHLASGDALALPANSPYTFRGDRASQRVTVFVVAAQRYAYDGPLQPQQSPQHEEPSASSASSRAALTPLAGAHSPELLQGISVAVGRATLPPGETVQFDQTDRSVFVAVESGTVVIPSDGAAGSFQAQQAGSASFLGPGAAITLANLDETPATVLLVTILPATESPETAP